MCHSEASYMNTDFSVEPAAPSLKSFFCPVDGGSRLYQNIGILVPEYTAAH